MLTTWPIKVPVIDVSGKMKNFSCLRCEQGYKNKKLVITNFSLVLQTPNSISCGSANRAALGV